MDQHSRCLPAFPSADPCWFPATLAAVPRLGVSMTSFFFFFLSVLCWSGAILGVITTQRLARTGTPRKCSAGLGLLFLILLAGVSGGSGVHAVAPTPTCFLREGTRRSAPSPHSGTIAGSSPETGDWKAPLAIVPPYCFRHIRPAEEFQSCEHQRPVARCPCVAIAPPPPALARGGGLTT